jgi:hypothetical protein
MGIDRSRLGLQGNTVARGVSIQFWAPTENRRAVQSWQSYFTMTLAFIIGCTVQKYA